MGILDRVLGSSSSELDEREAFAALAFCAVAADGSIGEEEAQGIATALGRMRLFAAVRPREGARMFEKIARLVRDEGAAVVVERAAARLPRELRATAYAVAVDLAMADGDVVDAEHGLLETVRAALALPHEEAQRIWSVLAIKNAA